MKVTKFSKSVNETLDSSKFYKVEDAFSMLMNFKRDSFNESVDVAFNLGVDPRHAEENIRLSINLPHGIGKIKSGWTDVDKIVVTPDLMVELGKLGKVLGPKGLMPNPKSGTVTNDVAKAIKELKAGKLDARVEKNGILQSSIGKTSFTEAQLKENFSVLQSAVMSAKPNSFKGKYLKSISISSTLGPGIKIGTE